MKRFLLYVLAVLVFSGMSLVIYDALKLHLFHMQGVSVFCDEELENVGITDTRSLEALKAYVASKEKFDELETYKRQNFFKDTLHVTNCSSGLLFSKRYNGARSVMLTTKEGKEVVLTVLTMNLRFDEEIDE